MLLGYLRSGQDFGYVKGTVDGSYSTAISLAAAQSRATTAGTSPFLRAGQISL